MLIKCYKVKERNCIFNFWIKEYGMVDYLLKFIDWIEISVFRVWWVLWFDLLFLDYIEVFFYIKIVN